MNDRFELTVWRQTWQQAVLLLPAWVGLVGHEPRLDPPPDLYRTRTWPAALRKKYNLTEEDYELLALQQDGVCAICGGRQKNGSLLCVDHDHKTGRVRGLLCWRCNTAIAFPNWPWFPELKQKAVRYLG
jgi:Recombination endonuclease VII